VSIRVPRDWISARVQTALWTLTLTAECRAQGVADDLGLRDAATARRALDRTLEVVRQVDRRLLDLRMDPPLAPAISLAEIERYGCAY
jgi:hypothetical protein